MTSALSGLNHVLRTTIVRSDNASRALSGLGSSLAVATSSSKGVNRALNPVALTANKVSRNMKKAGSQMEQFGHVTGLALRRFSGFTIGATLTFGLVRSFSEAVKEAISFERELVRISQISKISVASLSGLKNEVTNLSTEFGVSSAELLDVAKTLVQAGNSINDTTNDDTKEDE